MKKTICVIITSLIAMSGIIKAENYPYRSDYLFVTTPNHSDWLYKTGEKATIDIQFYKYGIPRDGEITYEIANDMLQADKTGKTTLKNGKASVNIGTRQTPGFRDLRITANVDGKKYNHHIKVGFSVDKIQPWTKEPADFMDFWQKNIKDIRKAPVKYTTEEAEEYSTDKMRCMLTKVNVDGQHSVYAYLFIPRNVKNNSCPAVLCPPGAGIKTIKEPLRHRYYGEGGCIRMEMEIHGIDPRLSENTFKDISNAFNNRNGGYLANGIENRDRYYMKHVYLALLRCIDVLTSLNEWDGKNLIVQGGSQGGALSIVAAALDKRVTQCVVNHPALSDMGAYSEKERTGGYPQFNKIEGMFTKDNLTTMAYYDVVNFARHLNCKVYMTWGYNDITCSPTTSYAVWNVIKCEKESLITPINEHWTSDATEYGQYEWIMKNICPM